jgi:hypothetical protein
LPPSDVGRAVEQQLGHDPSSGSFKGPDYPSEPMRGQPGGLAGAALALQDGAALKADPQALSRVPQSSIECTGDQWTPPQG